MRIESQTDWERVKREYDSDAPIVFDPEDELYDPNDDEAVRAAWAGGIVTVTRRGPDGVSVTRVVTLHLSPDVVAYYEAQGGDWQARMDKILRQGMAVTPGVNEAGDGVEAATS